MRASLVVPEDGAHLGIEVRHHDVGIAVVVVVAHVRAHAGLGLRVVTVGGAVVDADLAEAGAALAARVDEEEVRRAVVGHVEVLVAVRVEVSRDHTQSLASGLADPHGRGHVPEAAGSVVLVETVGDPLVRIGAAMHGSCPRSSHGLLRCGSKSR